MVPQLRYLEQYVSRRVASVLCTNIRRTATKKMRRRKTETSAPLRFYGSKTRVTKRQRTQQWTGLFEFVSTDKMYSRWIGTEGAFKFLWTTFFAVSFSSAVLVASGTSFAEGEDVKDQEHKCRPFVTHKNEIDDDTVRILSFTEAVHRLKALLAPFRYEYRSESNENSGSGGGRRRPKRHDALFPKLPNVIFETIFLSDDEYDDGGADNASSSSRGVRAAFHVDSACDHTEILCALMDALILGGQGRERVVVLDEVSSSSFPSSLSTEHANDDTGGVSRLCFNIYHVVDNDDGAAGSTKRWRGRVSLTIWETAPSSSRSASATPPRRRAFFEFVAAESAISEAEFLIPVTHAYEGAYRRPLREFQMRQVAAKQTRSQAVAKLEALGALVYEEGGRDRGENKDTSVVALGWDALAGAETDVARQTIEDVLLLPLKYPDAYDNVAKQTRLRVESTRPSAVLFSGPPGVGKTFSARIIAATCDMPMVYVPIESVMSKWFGESEKTLSAIFDAAEELGDDAIIFIDEIDALATDRSGSADGSGGVHAVTRRTLSVLLRKLDGFQRGRRSVLIAATNRSQDLDPALTSRFDLTIPFDLPGEYSRMEIFRQYARHLSRTDLHELAERSEGMSGRDIKEICEVAERIWVSDAIRKRLNGGEVSKNELHPPPFDSYADVIFRRRTGGECAHRESSSTVFRQPPTSAV